MKIMGHQGRITGTGLAEIMQTQLTGLMKKEILTILAALVCLLVFVTGAIYTRATDLTREIPATSLGSSADSTLHKPTVYVGVVSRYPPTVIYHGYQPIMDYLTRNTSYQFVLRLNSTYQQTVDELADGRVSAAFLGTYIYMQAYDRHAVTSLLKPLNENGEPLSHAVVITRLDSPIRKIEDLRGKRVAFPSHESFSGNWLPLYELKKHNISLSDLDSVHYFPHHQSVVYHVLKGSFDAGVVKERVAKEFLSRGLRIVYTSQPIPGSPIVISKHCSAAVAAALRDALLHIDVRRPEDRTLVAEWDQEFQYGFASASDSDYNALRVILHSVGGK
jgi:phosphonate transport system substrate-binding protein